MTLGAFDLAVCVAFCALILGTAFWKSRRRADSADYFLGGRSLPWWLIGISVVAANLSTEQFVGMAGQAYGDVGLAVSAWQLTGSIGVVLVAFVFLPRFLRAGIFTMPEFLEYRYDATTRALMSVLTIVIYAMVTTPAVLYSGGTALETIFGIHRTTAVLAVAAVGLAYVLWGGLLAAVWADLIQGTALLVGGIVTIVLGIHACGGWDAFAAHNAGKLHMVLPKDHAELPWTVLVGGMWIPIVYYCGLNQFLVQRALAARTVAQGQLGVIFAGALWLLVPFAIVMPGLVAGQLYGDHVARADQAYPTLVRELVPAGLRGFVLAALGGAVVSSLASMLNSASTLLTMDLWKRHLRRDCAERELVLVGRISTVLLLGLATVVSLSELLEGGVFKFIQEFQGYVSPGIVAAFVFGFVSKRAPAAAGTAALVLSAPVYGGLAWLWPDVAYLHRMLATFLVLIAVMAAITGVRPLAAPRVLPVRADLDTRSSPVVVVAGAAVVLAVVAFFVVFW
ncbi:MAG: sodium/solute symporter [Planctomycetes bacterium]|nr:sodium/solute symporter [Planctomycetota bacterium]